MANVIVPAGEQIEPYTGRRYRLLFVVNSSRSIPKVQAQFDRNDILVVAVGQSIHGFRFRGAFIPMPSEKRRLSPDQMAAWQEWIDSDVEPRLIPGTSVTYL